MKKIFVFVGLLLVGLLFCGTPVVLAENGTEECDAVALEKVLEQVRGITASAAFLREILPILNDTKKVVEDMVADQGGEGELDKKQPHEEQEHNESLQQYRDSVSRYFGRNSRPKPRND